MYATPRSVFSKMEANVPAVVETVPSYAAVNSYGIH